MTFDVEAYRSEFPVLEKKAYLISASLGPVSNRARRYLDEYVLRWNYRKEGAGVIFWEILDRARKEPLPAA